jgi:hypothetical protein
LAGTVLYLCGLAAHGIVGRRSQMDADR